MFTEWCKVTNARFESISKTCDRIESKCQIKNDDLVDLAINQIDYQLTIMKTHVLKIVDNTNLFGIHLERSERERKKLKNEIIGHVDQIYCNYEQDSHIPRYSTPFTEEKLAVKESLTPSLGKNIIPERDIPKL
ncbi:hypothetical protein O181_098391 [Austropuccinia psidii MF-1]|uniref:Uncharacterized protein n=1 Tax=Austropuccinia psidii MF-1 TaxID=1389203 RepID=A0A9Q3JBA5_9BASI|nr:hypothetical protein [Austropuccinia psidii MF-1]